MRLWTTLLGLALLTTGCAEFVEPPGPDFQAIVDDCDLGNHRAITIGDDGGSLDLTAYNEDVSTPSLRGPNGPEQLDCIVKGVQMPDHVFRSMETTRALDGRQEASWEFSYPDSDAAWNGELTAQWSFHGETGLNLIIVKQEEQ